MAENPTIFSNELREFLLIKILPTSEILSGNAQEKINNALGDYLIETRGESLTAYPRLFENLVSKYPREISNFLPKIFELKWWYLAYRLFNLLPELINLHPEYVKTSIENISLNIYQFREFKKICEKTNISLYKTIENHLKIEFREHFKALISISAEQLTIEWLKEKKFDLSTGILFYTEKELKIIIKHLLKLKIKWDHTNSISIIISQFLYFIQTNGKSHLLKEFLKEYNDLGYNLIRDYIRYEQLDNELIKELEISIFDIVDKDPKINSQLIDLLFGKNVVEAFKYHLESYPNKPHIFSVFFKAKPELAKEFTKVLENYYENINFGETPTKNHTYEYSDILFGTFRNNSSQFSSKFFILKIKEYLSNTRNREWFNPWSMNLLNNFDKMDEGLQQDIINLLIERKRYNSLSYSLARTPEKFSNFINQFLEMRSDNEGEIRSIIGIFILILRNYISDKIVFEKLKDMLFLMPNTYDKGLFLSFLGEKEKALECFAESLNKEISLSQKIFILTDYILEFLDTINVDGSIINLIALEEDIEQLKDDFDSFNIIKESSRKFPFKFHFLKARFMLFMGIIHMNLDDYDLSRQKLQEAETIFNNLLKSKNIPLYNKDIIKIYENISSVLSTFIKRIENLKKENNISQLNHEFSEQIKGIEFNPSSEDIKTKRIRISLENLCFTDGGKLKQLRFELPVNFCPLPQPIESIHIKIKSLGQKFFPWNHKLGLKTTSNPIDLSSDYQQIILLQKFAKKEGMNYYSIEVNGPKFLKIFPYTPEHKNGVNIFKFDIASKKFIGERDLKIVLKPNDICLVGIDLDLPIKYNEQRFESSNDQNKEIIINTIIKCIYQFQQKIKTIKESEDHYSEFLSSLINNLIDHRKWYIEEQKPSGISATSGKKKWEKIGGLGELDFVFMDEKNMILTICEALVLRFKDKKTINDHLLKIFNYDAIGLPFNFIIIYSKVVKFDELWPKYKKCVLNVPFKYKLKVKLFYDESDQYNIKSNLRMGKTVHIRQGKPMDLYHFFINTNF